jgi:hypothetical protein
MDEIKKQKMDMEYSVSDEGQKVGADSSTKSNRKGVSVSSCFDILEIWEY